MDFALVVRALGRGWWIMTLALAVTVAATAYFTFRQPFVYQAVTTLVAGPTTEITESRASVELLSNLDRRGVVATFSRILASRMMRQQAQARLDLSGVDMAAYVVAVRVVPDTNILQVSVDGPNPQIARQLANAIAEESTVLVREFYRYYQLAVLDVAEHPTRPIAPDRARNLGMAVVLGAMLGVALAFVAEYARGHLAGAGAPPAPGFQGLLEPRRSDG